MLNYAALQKTVAKVMKSVKQGTIYIGIPSGVAPADPNKPWLPGIAEPEPIAVDAVAFTVERKYVNGDTIVATDLQITAPHPGFEVTLSHKLKIDGAWYSISALERIPEAGTAVAWILFARK